MKDFLNKYFKLQENGTTIKTEFIAGLTTFLAMAYILFVNAGMLSKTGMSFGAVFTATAIAAIFGTLVMALLANYPVALAPGMGLNAFFTFGVVFGMGFTWQQALAAVFVSGILFMILSLSGIREKIINAIPNNLKYAVGGGIGLFIAFIGLKNAGIVAFDTPAGVEEGVAVVYDVIPMLGGFSGNTLLAVIGLIITIVLYVRGTKGAIFLGIVTTSIIGMIMGLVNLPTGITSMPEAPHFGAFIDGFSGVAIGQFLIVVFSFLFVDFFDTAGTLVTVGRRAGLINEEGELKGSSKALLADSTATVVGAVVGTSNTTSYIESLAGIEEGGRTGLTSVFTALFFFVFMFFSPLLSVVTAAVTAPALIMVGILMASQLKHIEWDKIEVAVPAFLTLILMPLTYSIANGIALGFIAYTISMVAKGKHKEISIMMYILSVIFIGFFIL